MSKFKNTEELEKAYKELEREFTKKSQKLAEVEKTNYVTLLHNEMDNLLNDYAKRRISDLEAKLAEKDKAIENWETMYKSVVQTCHNDKEEIKKLNKKYRDLIEDDYYKGWEITGLRMDIENSNQDKISFAVEQLEKVKELLLENLYDLYSKPSEIWDKYGDLYDCVVEGAVNGAIDNQINQLTHQHEDK